MISFAPLLNVMKQKGVTKTWLKTTHVLVGTTYTNVMAATKKPIHEGVSISAVDRLCQALDCQPGDILEYVADSEEIEQYAEI